MFSQALQITFVALLLTLFFVAVRVARDPGGDDAARGPRLDDVNVLVTWHFGGRQIVITEPLLRVAGFLGAFSGMYFTVVLATDATYRDEFAEDVGAADPPGARRARRLPVAPRAQRARPRHEPSR